ncbi:hypothetical protein [Filifactor alocis]|uniref:hypothetical protein n=1 Tax=Filifactor alocis TaxID=143361 RepID=UPI003FA0A3B1
MIENLNEKLERVHQIDSIMSKLKREKDEITAGLQSYGLEVIENRNLKHLELTADCGSCNVGYKEKLTVDNLEKLKEVCGSIVDAKAKITMEPKIEFTDKKFQMALIALYKQEYKQHNIPTLLNSLGLDDKESKAVMKKLKGDYFKDKALLESYHANDDDLEEELDMIKEQISYELVTRYFDIDTINIDDLKKAIFVEDTLAVGYKFKD